MSAARPKAVVLLSGGLDSATALAIAHEEGFATYALSFAYGQRHAVEVAASRQVAAHLGAREHRVSTIDLRMFGGSALTDDIAVPKDRPRHEIEEGIPATYVPARNTIFLSLALGWSETLNARDIFLGVNAVDYSGYPDCRPEFLRAFEALAATATKAGLEGRGIRLHAPLMHLRKAQIIARGRGLGVDYGITRSCYDPDPLGRACGRCDSCQIRLQAFAEIGVADPAPYQGPLVA